MKRPDYKGILRALSYVMGGQFEVALPAVLAASQHIKPRGRGYESVSWGRVAQQAGVRLD